MTAAPPYYEIVEHTADLAVLVRSASLPELYVNAARALFALMTDPPTDMRDTRRLAVESLDRESLLVDWLNELIALHEIERETYVTFRITALTDTRLEAEIAGGPTTHRTRGIKAATFHDLRITDTGNGWEAQLVFDV